MYSLWKIMCFFYLKPHKRIALHQIPKMMFFSASSYDPFNPFIFGGDKHPLTCLAGLYPEIIMHF